jgi:hypothetical protein
MKITHHQESSRYENLNFLILIKINMKYIKLVIWSRGVKMEWQGKGRWEQGE